jgi:hypothetical protein
MWYAVHLDFGVNFEEVHLGIEPVFQLLWWYDAGYEHVKAGGNFGHFFLEMCTL